MSPAMMERPCLHIPPQEIKDLLLLFLLWEVAAIERETFELR